MIRIMGFLGLYGLSVLLLVAQIPAPPQSHPIYLIGGTIHIGDGTVIHDGVIGFSNGKITVVTSRSAFDSNSVHGEIVDVSGQHIYPGLIALNTTLGLREIDAVRATRDEREVGELNPNVRAIVAYNVDSRIIPTVRSNGILLAQIVPRGSLVTGQSSVVQLDAWTWEETAYAMDNGIHIIWPLRSFVEYDHYKRRSPHRSLTSSYRKTVRKRLDQLRRLFEDAQLYCQATEHLKPNLKLAALCDLFTGKKILFVHTNDAKGIISAIEFFRPLGIRPVIVGGAQSHLVLDELQRDSIAVILTRVHRLPPQPDAPIDLPYRLPVLLHQHGILFAIAASGSWDQRNLPFHVGTAIAYGLPYEVGVQAVTANAAKILGIEHQTGILASGYDATIVVSTGDIFDIRHNRITLAFIQGRKIDLDNLQQQQYRKYLQRYGLQPR